MAILSAQNPPIARVAPFFRPGDTLRLSVAFDGPNIDDINRLEINLILNGPQLSDQRGFDAQLNGGESKRVSTGTFEVSFKIPEGCATGDYYLRVLANVSGRTIIYKSPEDFPQKIFRIENSRHLPEPKIKSITELR
jgi:hypothetical protein